MTLSARFFPPMLRAACPLLIVIAIATNPRNAASQPSAPAEAPNRPAFTPTIDSPKGFFLDDTVIQTIARPNGRTLLVVNSVDESPPKSFVYHPEGNHWVVADSAAGVSKIQGLLELPGSEQFFALGKSDNDQRVLAKVFDLQTGHWRSSSELPSEFPQKSNRILPLSNGRVLVLSTSQHRIGWVYDTKTDTWSETPEIPDVGGNVMLTNALGRGAALAIFMSPTFQDGWAARVYDSEKNIWRLVPPLQDSKRISPLGSTKLVDSSVLLIGRSHTAGKLFSVLLDPDALTWKATGQPPPVESEFTQGIKTLANGKVLMLTNQIPGNTQARLFDPKSLTWTDAGVLPADITSGLIGDAMPNGDLWVIGYGRNGPQELLRSAVTGNWVALRPMPTGFLLLVPALNSPKAALLALGHPRGAANSRDVVESMAYFEP